MTDQPGELLSVEDARKMTRKPNGRCVGRQRFREWVKAGIIPSWQDPRSPRGELFIPRVAMEEWLRTIADHNPKATRS